MENVAGFNAIKSAIHSKTKEELESLIMGFLGIFVFSELVFQANELDFSQEARKHAGGCTDQTKPQYLAALDFFDYTVELME